MKFSELAVAKFRKLDRSVRKRIAKKLRDTAGDPRRFLTRLTSVEAYRLRVGDYRVIVDVDWEREIILVLTLGHRSIVYR